MPVDLTKPFQWERYDLEQATTPGDKRTYRHWNSIASAHAVAALERARAEIDVASSNTMNGEYDYQRGLVAASAIITRLLETKP